MPIIYILRHAQSTANVKGILAGQDNSVKLSKTGVKQSNALTQYLISLKIEKIYSSPMTRCVQTITPYLKSSPDTDFQVEPALIEMNYGAWTGRKLSTLSKEKKWSQIQNKPSTFVFPKGESFKSMRARVDKLVSDSMEVKGPLLLVTHGDVIKMFIASALKLPIDQFQKFVAEPASITTLSLSKQGNSLLQSNFKLLASDMNAFKSNQLGGGNMIAKSQRWWAR